MKNKMKKKKERKIEKEKKNQMGDEDKILLNSCNH